MIPFMSLWTRMRHRLSPGRAGPSTAAARPPGPILFLGDSITGYWPLERPEVFAAHGFINRGVGGALTGQVRAALAEAVAETRPIGVHLLCGINDIAHRAAHNADPGLRDNIVGMVAEARALGLRVWIGSLTPADWLIWGNIDPRPEIAAENAWLRTHAAHTGSAFIDYHAVLAAPSGALRPEYSADGLHLTAAGYATMEPVLLKALTANAAR